jgi:DNA-binding CsgD family transcriptional regulator
MSPVPKYLYQLEDYAGCLWNVRFERQTTHGWPLLLGRRPDPTDGNKNHRLSGDTVIITKELAAYLETMRRRPRQIDLPICVPTIRRLRRVLRHSFQADLIKWWDEHVYDLTASKKDVAEVYGIGCATVWRYARKRGVVHEHLRWSEEEKTQLLRLLKTDLSTREIAEKMGRSPHGIRNMRLTLIGPLPSTRPWTEEEKAETLRLLASGIKVQEIADRLGRTKQSVFSLRRREIGTIPTVKVMSVRTSYTPS